MSGRHEIFISYAHKNEEWRDLFQRRLESVAKNYSIKIWSDQHIQPGADWNREIQEALSRARMALLLVSSAFLESEFIKSEELPKILESHRRRGLYIRWVPIEDALIEETPLRHIQATVPTNEPLGLIQNGAKLNQAVNDIVREILDVLATRPGTAEGQPFPIGDKLTTAFTGFEEIGRGDMSIIYRAERADDTTASETEEEEIEQAAPEHSAKKSAIATQVETERDIVAIKVLGSTGDSALSLERFRRPFSIAKQLRHETFIKVRDYSFDAEAPAIVMDFVEQPNLWRYLQKTGEPLNPQTAAKLLRQLADAMAEAHDLDLVNANLRPGNIYIDADAERVRMSPVSFCSEVSRLDRARGIVTLSGSRMAFMPPEVYLGLQTGPATDQYLLGMLGLVMLYGKAPMHIRRPADMSLLDHFYRGPEHWSDAKGKLDDLHRFWFDKLRIEAPQLAVILRRLLKRQPRNRFAGMREIARNLTDYLESVEQPPVHIDEAKTSFSAICDGDLSFYEDFYANLCGQHVHIDQLFARKIPDMTRHYTILDEAIERLLNFRPGAEPTTLTRLAKRHADLGMHSDDFDHFGEAFIQTLAERKVDTAVLDSWRATLKPGLDYLKAAVTSGPLEATNKAESEAAPVKPRKGKAKKAVAKSDGSKAKRAKATA